jgi:hypothetical protein
MLREIVRTLFLQLARRSEADGRDYRRADLVAGALAFATQTGKPDLSPSGMTSAVDAELSRWDLQRWGPPQWGYLVERTGSGLYRFRPLGSEFASGAPPISQEVLDKVLPPERGGTQRRPDVAPPSREGRGPVEPRMELLDEPGRAARSFSAGEFGAMDARTLVATDLLQLKGDEWQSLFALQGVAL